MSEVFALPSRLDSSGALPLMQALLARRGQSLTLDASQVDMLGALALEVIVAAGRQWEVDRQPLAVTRPSDRFSAGCNALGLCPDTPWKAIRPAGQEARA